MTPTMICPRGVFDDSCAVCPHRERHELRRMTGRNGITVDWCEDKFPSRDECPVCVEVDDGE